MRTSPRIIELIGRFSIAIQGIMLSKRQRGEQKTRIEFSIRVFEFTPPVPFR
jgi:hypothetical protein